MTDRPRIVKYQGGTLKNGRYGYPAGKPRRIDPWVLMAVHITGNRNTASMPVGIGPGSGTRAEVAYMARPNSTGNSAHDYIARDGAILACIPTRFAAYNNGILLRPNMDLKSIQRIVREHAKGTNPNEAYVREVECTGYPGSFPLTKEQRETVAGLIARDSLKWDLPITRETVHMHRDLDSVNRASCPFTGDQEQQLSRIITRARQIKADLKDPEPEPEPEPEPDALAEALAALKAAEGRVDALEAEVAELRENPPDCTAALAAQRASLLAAVRNGVGALVDGLEAEG